MPNLGATEIILVILVLVLLFGARKLPELARGTGRALRIFKSETKGLTDDEETAASEETERSLPPSTSQTPPTTESSDPERAARDQQQQS